MKNPADLAGLKALKGVRVLSHSRVLQGIRGILRGRGDARGTHRERVHNVPRARARGVRNHVFQRIPGILRHRRDARDIHAERARSALRALHDTLPRLSSRRYLRSAQPLAPQERTLAPKSVRMPTGRGRNQSILT